MIGSRSPKRLLLFACFSLFLAASRREVRATTLEQQTLDRLSQIRAVRVSQTAEAAETYNRQMDDAWQFFAANKAQVLHILRSQMKAELAREPPNDLILLDVGFFLYENGGAEGKALGLNALFRLNPKAPIVEANAKELFEFAHAAARDHEPRVLPFIESAFLASERTIVIPQHALELDGTLACVFLYGAYGPDSESALRAKLKDKPVGKRVLELLGWLGSPASLPEVREVSAAAPDFETFTRVTSYMMLSAGPAGRDFMLNLNTESLDARSKEYYSKIQKGLRETSFETIRTSLAGLPGETSLPDAEVKARLSAMIADFGMDDRTNPLAILNSGLGSETLIAELSTVRRRRLHLVSDEALSDVQLTNLLLNGLRYRGK